MTETTTETSKRRLSRAESHCSITGCKRPYRAKGLCVTHYKTWRRGALEGYASRYKICSKEACRKPRAQGSLCTEHASKQKEGS